MKSKQDIIGWLEKALNILFFLALIFLFLRARIFKIHLPFVSISMTSARNLMILMGFIWAALFTFRGFRLTRKTSIDKGIAIFLLWFIICCVFAENIKMSFNALFVMLVYVSFYFICSNLLTKEEKIKVVFYLLITCSAIVAVIDFIYHYKVGIFDIIEKYPFWPGKQAISLFLVLSFLMLISVTVFNWRNIKNILRAVYILILAVQLICLVFTYSRGACFALSVSLLIIIFFKSRKLLYSLLLLLCLAALFSPPSARDKFGSIFTTRTFNIKQRVTVWKTTLVLINDNLAMGIGPGNFGIVHLERYRKPGDDFSWWKANYHAHNLYMQIASETGIPGLVIFLFLIWKIIVNGYSLIRNEKDRFLLGARIGAYSAFLGYLFWSTIECTYTGEFSPLSFFHMNLIMILYINLILYTKPSIDV